MEMNKQCLFTGHHCLVMSLALRLMALRSPALFMREPFRSQALFIHALHMHTHAHTNTHTNTYTIFSFFFRLHHPIGLLRAVSPPCAECLSYLYMHACTHAFGHARAHKRIHKHTRVLLFFTFQTDCPPLQRGRCFPATGRPSCPSRADDVLRWRRGRLMNGKQVGFKRAVSQSIGSIQSSDDSYGQLYKSIYIYICVCVCVSLSLSLNE